MMAQNAQPGPEWLSAKTIAARSGGEVAESTVRSWWKNKLLAYEELPQLGKKSNKRTHRDVVDAHLRLKNIEPVPFPGERPNQPDATGNRTSADTPESGHPRRSDALDALASVKSAADAAIDAVITEAEAAADAATRRLATLKALRTALRGYDMAVTVLIEQPAPPNPIANPEERHHELP